MIVAIIGGGNLGANLARGIKSADAAIEVHVSRRTIHQLDHLQALGILVHNDNKQCIENASIILIAVKPHQLDDVLTEIAPKIKKQLVISLATGK